MERSENRIAIGETEMKLMIALFMATLVSLTSVSYAATAYVPASVERTLVADRDRWGGCMILIDQQLSDYGLDCPSRWISFSCNGTFTTKDVAYRLFDSVQMAVALGKRVQVEVDDTRKHNGYCFGSRVDVLF
jgi:hypothetical protein